MTDTPEYIKDLQLQLWLSKTPEERLLQFIMENDAWWTALREAKANMLSALEENSGTNNQDDLFIRNSHRP
jgi:predicted nucleic acid-binding Zn ribbon protein